MTAKWCTDCNQDRSTAELDVLSITPVTGWTAEFAVLADDGSHWETWTELVLGWAIIRRHFEEFDGHETRVEPAVLSDGMYPEPVSEYLELRGGTKVRWHLVPPGGALSTGPPEQPRDMTKIPRKMIKDRSRSSGP